MHLDALNIGHTAVQFVAEPLMTKALVMLVEDERDIQELVRYNLAKENYRVICLSSGEECLRRAVEEKPDLILLDIMLPGSDGFDVTKKLQSNPFTAQIPIIMLTAKGEDADVVTGLELGAIDYITKPFSPKVLIARVRNALRQRLATPGNISEEIVSRHGLHVDPMRYEVSHAGNPIILSHTEFKVLHLLMRNAGRVLSRVRIVDGVHGDDYPVTERSIDVQIVGLRKKLGSLGDYIETVRGVGYRFRE